ncbi:MAG TPA: hypothetical protein VNE17_04115, partial [Nitrolancea sp.]|nr:hypothetical protein [Nitrolancea sp.]
GSERKADGNERKIETSGEQSASSGEACGGSSFVHLPRVLRVMVTNGIVLILLDTAIGLIEDGKLSTSAISGADLPSLLLQSFGVHVPGTSSS